MDMGIYLEKKDKMSGKTLTISTQYAGSNMRRYTPRMTSRHVMVVLAIKGGFDFLAR